MGAWLQCEQVIQISLPVLVFLLFNNSANLCESCGSGRLREALEFIEAKLMDSISMNRTWCCLSSSQYF